MEKEPGEEEKLSAIHIIFLHQAQVFLRLLIFFSRASQKTFFVACQNICILGDFFTHSARQKNPIWRNSLKNHSNDDFFAKTS